MKRNTSLFIFAFVFFVSPLGAASLFRVVFVTSLEPLDAERIVQALEIELERRWPTHTRKRTISIETVKYAFDTSGKPLEVNEKILRQAIASTPDLFYVGGGAAAKQLSVLTSTIPIVIGCRCNFGPTSRDWRIVENQCSPERNVTGFTRLALRFVDTSFTTDGCVSSGSSSTSPAFIVEDVFSKSLEYLTSSSIRPMKRVGLIFGDSYDENKWKYTERARALNVELRKLQISASQIEQLPYLMRENSLDGAIVISDSLLALNATKLIGATSKAPIPTIFPWDEADRGAWMHFGTRVNVAEEAARYIVAILQGTPIGKLPVSFPTEYELVVNHKLAREHGWVFPKKFLLLPQREPRRN